MKTILLSLIFCVSCFAADGDVMPPKGPAEELQDLSKQMSEMTDKLREDRTDPLVQAQGKDIEDKIGSMTDKMEKEQQQQQQKDKQAQKQKQNSQQAEGKTPAQRHELRNGEEHQPPPPSDEIARVIGGKDKWSKLPPALRDEILQSYKEDLPERWRDRIKAYFYSIAQEETKKQD